MRPEKSLQWRHNRRDGVLNHQPLDCLLNRLFGRRSKKKSKLRVTGLCAGIHRGPVNFPRKGPVTRKMFPFHDVIMCASPVRAVRAASYSSPLIHHPLGYRLESAKLEGILCLVLITCQCHQRFNSLCRFTYTYILLKMNCHKQILIKCHTSLRLWYRGLSYKIV